MRSRKWPLSNKHISVNRREKDAAWRMASAIKTARPLLPRDNLSIERALKCHLLSVTLVTGVNALIELVTGRFSRLSERETIAHISDSPRGAIQLREKVPF